LEQVRKVLGITMPLTEQNWLLIEKGDQLLILKFILKRDMSRNESYALGSFDLQYKTYQP
jgi:hypothetical protein